MSDFRSEIDRAVSAFVTQITDLARHAALSMLEDSLGRGGAIRPRLGSRGAKRSASDLEQLSHQVVAFISKNPGLRIEQINRQLGLTTKQLALPIRKLVANGAIKTKGKKRSTTYFAK